MRSPASKRTAYRGKDHASEAIVGEMQHFGLNALNQEFNKD